MTKEEIDKLCKQYKIQKYTINSDGSIDVDGNVYISNQSFILPLKFNKVTGYFDCSNSSNLTSLEGSPKEVGGYFTCTRCPNLTSLEGSPKEVGGNFSCSECPKLTNLEGSPKQVGGDFVCFQCLNLTTLEGSPKEVGRNFNCSFCSNLASLQGSPNKVGGNFYCTHCPNLKNPYEFRYALYTTCTAELDSDHKEINNIINKYKGNSSMYHIAIEELLDLSDKLGFKND